MKATHFTRSSSHFNLKIVSEVTKRETLSFYILLNLQVIFSQKSLAK